MNVPTSPVPPSPPTEPDTSTLALSTSSSSSSMTTNPGGGDHKQISSLLDTETKASDKLTVTREEIVKGVVIKGIVCTPKSKAKNKNKHLTDSNVSLNPFEKRRAPKPPSGPNLSESVPKTKSKKRGVSKS